MSTDRPPVLCRVCAVPTAPETSWNVFDCQVAAEGYNLAQLISLVGGIEVRPEEAGLSSWCCSPCQLDVGIAYRVRVLCQESDRKLRKMLLEDAGVMEPVEETQAFEIVTVCKMEVEEPTQGDSAENLQITTKSNVFEVISNTKKHCCSCDQLFDSDEEILEHSKTDHAVINPPKATKDKEICNICHRLMDRRYLELLKETPKTLFRCTICSKLFFTKKQACSHYFTEHASTTTCNDCDLRFDSTEALGRHFEQVHLPHRGQAENEVPSECSMRYETDNEPNSHQNRRRSIDDKQKFKCSKCPKLLATQEALQFHEYGHQNPFGWKCTRCAEVFTDYNKYKTHLSVHRNRKDQHYSCDKCGGQFKFRSSLSKHVAKYCIQQPHKCRYCPSSYARQYELSKHMNKMHHAFTKINEGQPEPGQQSEQILVEVVTESIEPRDTIEGDAVCKVEVEEPTIRTPEAEKEDEETKSSIVETTLNHRF